MPKVSSPKRNYPWNTTINGKAYTLRLMERKDSAAIVKFAQSLPPDDLVFLSVDLTDAEAVDKWLEATEAGRNLTVLTETEGQIVGFASLSYNELTWTRHLGQIWLLVNPNQRGRGLGKLLVNEVFALAQELNLQKLVARMAAEQRGALQVFEHLGFKAEALLADQVIDREDRTHDLIIMSYDVNGFSD